MDSEIVYPALRKHVRRFFKGHRWQEYDFTKGPPGRNPEAFRAARFAPGPRTPLTTYVSLGSWEAEAACDCRVEFVVVTQQPEMEAVELLAMTSYYHRTRTLDVGHTFSLGRKWLNGTCDHFLVSLPYPFGPDLEHCRIGEDGHVRFLWLLPITEAEKSYRHEHGLEALEQQFDAAKFNYSFWLRNSVV